MSDKLESQQKTIMNGPVEFEMKVWVINDETEQAGCATMHSVYFEYPTPHAIAERVAEFEKTQLTGALKGFRLMTKQEAFSAVMLEKTGQSVALAASPEWDPV